MSPEIPGHGEAEGGEGEEARAAAAAAAKGRRSLATRRGRRRAGAGGRRVRGRRLPAAPVPRVAWAAAAGALGGAGPRHRRARAFLPPMGRRTPRRPAVPRRLGVHARVITLRVYLRPFHQRRDRPRVAPVSSSSSSL